mmetsp:Transcript_40361/g.87382  ORF Transcript_40361/g.87382 Transcript_40361/m.87382 type:complete len:232 (+) Transcript_40361:538-1233(+)
MPQSIFDWHALHRISMHQLCHKVLRIVGQAAADTFHFEELRYSPLTEQQKVRILHCRIGALEEGHRGEKVEGVPSQAPGVYTAGQVVLFVVKLWWSKIISHQTVERDRFLLTSCWIHHEGHCLSRISNSHLPLPILIQEKEHILQRDVLHCQAAHVKAGQTSSSIKNHLLRLLFLKASTVTLKSFHQVTPSGQLHDHIVPVIITERILQLHHIVKSLHHFCEADLTQRRFN